MFERLRDLFRPDTDNLEGVTTPVAVSLHAKVASPNDVTSPLSGLRAAFFEIDFTVERPIEIADSPYAYHRRATGVGNTLLEHVGSAFVGGDLWLEAPGGRVLLAARQFAVEFRGLDDHGTPVEKALPPGFEHIAAAPATARGLLSYRELFLSNGDDVQLVATVERAAAGSPYRSPNGEASFVARPDLARVLVRYRAASLGLGASHPRRFLVPLALSNGTATIRER